MNMHKKIWKNAAACLLAALMFPGCSDDEGGGTTPTGDGLATLVVTLQAENSSEPVGTRAEGNPSEDTDGTHEDDYERKIENWWVLIYDEAGTFIDYLSNKKNSPASEPSGEDSQFTTSIELPIGKYRLYGFANLNSLIEADELIKSIESGIDESLLVAEEDNGSGQAVNLGNVLERFNTEEKPSSIPMSAYSEDVTLVDDESQNNVSLGLYRMIGKVQMTVTNQTGDDITLNGFTMGKFRTLGTNFLMPYAELGNLDITKIMQPIFPNGTTHDYGSHSYTVADDEKLITDDASQRFTFYVPETPQKGQNNGSAPMQVTFNIAGRSPITRDTDFDFVRRNDLLVIPVTISNIESKLTYKNLNMPIGGIPEEIITQSKDGISIDAPCYVVAQKAGRLEIEYEFTTIAEYGGTDIQIRYTNERINSALNYSKATLTDNIKGSNDYGLVIDNDGNVIQNGSPITLTPSTINETNDTYILGGPTGTLTFYTQELANNATATINLKLVAVCTNAGGSTEVEIPYTITIQNYSNEQQP